MLSVKGESVPRPEYDKTSRKRADAEDEKDEEDEEEGEGGEEEKEEAEDEEEVKGKKNFEATSDEEG